MENNEELVLENTENVEEQATEELVEGNNATETTEEPIEEVEEKLYSESEFNSKLDELLSKKIARKEAKIRREYESKYGRVEELLKAGLEKESFEDAVDTLENFYEEKGIKVSEPHYTERDTKILADAEANDIISGGYEDIIEETDRLAKLIENGKASDMEKLVFQKIASERKKQEELKELANLGVQSSELEDKKFKDFIDKLNPSMSLKEKYEMYQKFNPKPKVEPIGSMKTETSKQDEVKDFYTFEEASKYTREDLDKNPKLVEAIEKSMLEWK